MGDDNENILSQDEIDSLLDASDSGEEEAQESQQGERDDVSAYDFRRPKLITQDRLELFSRIHNTFTNTLQSRLFQLLHLRMEVTPIAFDQQQYKAYISSSGEVTYARLLEMPPLPGLVIMEISPTLLVAFDDLLLGGTGEAPQEDRELTDTELAIAQPVLDSAVESLTQTFSNIAESEPRIHRDESNPEYLQAASQEAPVVTLNFQISSQDLQGAVNLCYPLPFVQHVLEHTGATGPDTSNYFRSSSESTQDVDILGAISDVPLPIDVLLGETKINAGDWLNIREGDILMCGSKIDDPVVLRINKHKRLLGRPGVTGDNLAVKIKKRTV